MTLTTDKGKTFDIHWAWAPAGADGDLMLEYEDERDLAAIVADFDGVAHFHRASELEGDMDFDGFTRIKAVVRDFRRGTVQLTLAKGADAA